MHKFEQKISKNKLHAKKESYIISSLYWAVAPPHRLESKKNMNVLSLVNWETCEQYIVHFIHDTRSTS